MKKKNLIILLLIVLVIVVLGAFYFINKIKNKDNEQENIKPPKLYIYLENSDEKIECITGSYAWSENGMSVIADSVHPIEFEYTNKNIINYTNSKIILDNISESTKINKVSLYEIGNTEELENNIILETNSIKLENLKNGEYVLEIVLDYVQGRVHYVVKIVKGNEDKIEYNSFVGTVLEETNTYMIVEPNQDEKERKSSDKIKINYGEDHVDYLYGVGRKVLIKYTGYIMETYPAQINTNIIETEGYEDFELYIIESKDKNKTKKKILNNAELSQYNQNYDLYYYGIDEVNVKVDNKEMTLEEALRSGKITLNGIISKANKDVKEAEERYNQYSEEQSVPKLFPYSEMYKDGGTMEYHYKDYTIIKKHSLDGNRDVYIGVTDMILNEVN